MFRDRKDAGEKLAISLSQYEDDENAVVVGIPRGGVVPGNIISKRLGLPLELALVKKIGHPSNPEYAIGAVSLKNQILDRNVDPENEFIQVQIQNIRQLLEKRTAQFYGDQKPMSLSGKSVILVDDGIATGKTLLASVDLIRQEKPRQIIVAIPVGPPESIEAIRKVADRVICLETPTPFNAIGLFYQNFEQVTDREAIALFAEVRNR